MATNAVQHCDYGNHDTTDGSLVCRCARCNKRICVKHTANNAYACPGDEVACPDHKNEIDRKNDARWEKLKAGL